MGKLHELLAVEGQLEGKAKKVVEETVATFKGKQTLFYGGVKTCKMNDESMQQTAPPTLHKKMETTVQAKLGYTIQSIIQYIDALSQKEATNQTAKANLEIDGVVVVTDVPATLLLGLEKRLNVWRNVFASIPTLQVGIEWVKDEQQGPDVYKQVHATETIRTAKTFMHKVLYDATKDHKAQIEKWEEQIPVGKYIEEVWAGVLSSAEKARMLERFDNLLAEVKKARQRANTAEVVNVDIGKVVFDYILNNE